METVRNKNTGYGYAWWTAPDLLALFFILPILILCYLFGANILAMRHVHSYYSFIGIIGLSFVLVIFSLFAFIGRKLHFRPLKFHEIPIYILDILFGITCFAYLIWFGPLIFDHGIFNKVFLQDTLPSYVIRNVISTIPGVTTLTQSGLAYICLYIYFDQKQSLEKRHHIFLYLILAFGLLRSFLWSERLAFFELIVMYGIYASYQMRRKKYIAFIPYVGILFLFLIFGVFEYFRSWHHYSHYYSSIINFTVNRVMEYYVFAVNSGLGIIDRSGTGLWGHFPYYSFIWLYKMPIVGSDIVHYFGIKNPTNSFLNLYGDPELNNVSGIAAIIYDYGFVGSLLFVSLLGFIIGISYRGFQRASGMLRLYYPIFMVGVIEFPRILYFFDPRAIVAYMIIFVIIVFYLFREII